MDWERNRVSAEEEILPQLESETVELKHFEEPSSLSQYCINILKEEFRSSVEQSILREDEVSEFRSQVNKMKMWPTFDHIFKAARRDEKWYLRSQPLRGINRILVEEQRLVDISKVGVFQLKRIPSQEKINYFLLTIRPCIRV
ncbi:hypothetical protein HWI79_1595 [Cryptosporidium felis]|nr:hypothetical protein HWI79_1595 [Cryptosporidium felis]